MFATFHAMNRDFGAPPAERSGSVNIQGTSTNDNLGFNVYLSPNGKFIAVSSPYSNNSTGYVDCWYWNSTYNEWNMSGIINGPSQNSFFGYSVCIASDADSLTPGNQPASQLLFITDINGNIYQYYWQGSWIQRGVRYFNNPAFKIGWLDMTHDESSTAEYKVVLSQYGQNSQLQGVAVYRYNYIGYLGQLGRTIQLAGWVADHQFGSDISISHQAPYVLAIAAPQQNRVYIYEWLGTDWTADGSAFEINGVTGDYAGFGIHLSGDGNTIVIASAMRNNRKGAVRVYRKSGSSWPQLGGDIDGESDDDRFGEYSVAISSNGNRIAIGAPQPGADSYPGNADDGPGYVKVYDWNGSSWNEIVQKIEGNSNGDKCFNVALSGDGQVLSVSSTYENHTFLTPVIENAGVTRLYSLPAI